MNRSLEASGAANRGFDHFLLTRFNIRAGFDSSGRRLDDDWLNHRFDLFEEYCISSVAGQSCRNFHWLVFFDEKTPRRHRERAKALSIDGTFMPVYSRDFRRELREAVASRLSGAGHLLTSRIDNDDAIGRDFVKDVQAHFNSQTFEFLTFARGYTWDLRTLFLCEDPLNPFASLIEPAADFRTVFCGEHTQLPRLGPVHKIWGKPAWLRVVHGRNIRTKVRGVRLMGGRELLREGFALGTDSAPNAEDDV
jgi:hypothetical protein